MSLGSALKKILPNFMLVGAIRLKDAMRSSPERARAKKQFEKMGRPSAILAGPFKGMKYYPESRGWVLTPKLLGIYEKELHGVVEEIIAASPDVVFDIGSAEGYYAVGFAYRLPAGKVVCYDTDRYANHLLRTNIKNNDVGGRMELHGFCSPEVLQQALESPARPVVLCDCEGYEDVLLDPVKVPNLKKARVIVELHPMFSAGIKERLAERFAATHVIATIDTKERTSADWPEGAPRVDDESLAMSERRPCPMQWFYMVPK
jgi:hypothetical protein